MECIIREQSATSMWLYLHDRLGMDIVWKTNSEKRKKIYEESIKPCVESIMTYKEIQFVYKLCQSSSIHFSKGFVFNVLFHCHILDRFLNT
jgi:hypothetical protein